MSDFETTCLTNQFLIAMPNLEDPEFFHTVSYICNHDDEGAMGVTINRPLDVGLGDLLEHLNMPTDDPDISSIPVYAGGPVQTDRGFVLHQTQKTSDNEWDAIMEVSDSISLTMSQDIIEAIALNEGPQRYLIMLGYAGWTDGQLEQELLSNAWLSGIADEKVIFETPSELKWTQAARHLGVELGLISTEVGHA
ncbi:YqgE/AlgH family protein [Beggiatoa alba]|nr:YqgE/AlgH family protein [Beggiatoa alba]